MSLVLMSVSFFHHFYMDLVCSYFRFWIFFFHLAPSASKATCSHSSDVIIQMNKIYCLLLAFKNVFIYFLNHAIKNCYSLSLVYHVCQLSSYILCLTDNQDKYIT